MSKVRVLFIGGPADGRREDLTRPLPLEKSVPHLQSRLEPARHFEDASVSAKIEEARYIRRRLTGGPEHFVEVYVHVSLDTEAMIDRLVAGYLAVACERSGN